MNSSATKINELNLYILSQPDLKNIILSEKKVAK